MTKKLSEPNFFDGEYYSMHTCERCKNCVYTKTKGDSCILLNISVKKTVRNDCIAWNKSKDDINRITRKAPKLKYWWKAKRYISWQMVGHSIQLRQHEMSGNYFRNAMAIDTYHGKHIWICMTLDKPQWNVLNYMLKMILCIYHIFGGFSEISIVTVSLDNKSCRNLSSSLNSSFKPYKTYSNDTTKTNQGEERKG